jgi:DNA-binding LacI/PurR family transcriptional regulator
MSVTRIAKIAGVSVATVSRVLNNHPTVRPETAEQVRRVIEDLRYRVPAVRRGPRNGRRGAWRTGNIAVLAAGELDHTDFRIPLFAAALSGVLEAARSMELNVLIDDVPSARDVPAAVRNRDIDGALLLLAASSHGMPEVIAALRRHVPVVRVMGESLGVTEVDHVGPDNAAVGRLAYDYLRLRGCEEVAFVTAFPGWDINRTRALGFAAGARRDAPVPTMYIVSADPLESDYYGGRVVRCGTLEELTDRLASASPRHSGLFISRDRDTAQIYPLLRERHIKPGTDVQVVSCDNDEVLLSVLDPRPASIDLCPDEIGRRALIRLAARMRRSDEPAFRMLVYPKLVAPPARPATHFQGAEFNGASAT